MMKGLLIKDFFLLKKTMNVMLLIGGFYIVAGAVWDGMQSLGMMFGFLTPIMAINIFYYDDAAKWNSYCTTLPIPRGTVVLSRYVLALLLSGVGMCISALNVLVVNLVRPGSMEKAEVIIFILGGGLLAVIYNCFIFPMVYKFGSERARFLSIIVLAGLVGGGGGIGYLLSKTSLNFTPLLDMLPYLVPVLLIVIVAVSYLISKKIYCNKDF